MEESWQQAKDLKKKKKASPGPVNRASWLQMENNAFKRQKNEFVTAPTKRIAGNKEE